MNEWHIVLALFAALMAALFHLRIVAGALDGLESRLGRLEKREQQRKLRREEKAAQEKMKSGAVT
ncbi:MAG: hypothetical protein ACYTHJ_01145 [Planctomycetota bacterium]